LVGWLVGWLEEPEELDRKLFKDLLF